MVLLDVTEGLPLVNENSMTCRECVEIMWYTSTKMARECPMRVSVSVFSSHNRKKGISITQHVSLE